MQTQQYRDKAIELMPRERLKELQLTRLKETVARVYANVPYYRDKMREIGVEPGDVRTLDDLRHLPFLTKQDLRDTYPYGLFAAPLEDIVRLHASSGTTGKQIVAGYTRRDLDVWAECMARCLVMTGADKHSRVHVSYGYGLFTGGLGVHGGAEKIGAVTIPASSGNTRRQINLLKDLKATVLCCTPSYALYLAEALVEMGFSKDDLSLEAGCFGAEPWTAGMKARIEDGLGLKAFDIYGLTEVMGPSVSQTCSYQNGLHIWEDVCIAEIIDPDTGEVLPEGSTGELVFTTIYKEGMPLIRYRTRDICRLNPEKCECGREHIRMARPDGRTDDMLIIRGVNVFPSQIEGVLLSSGEAAPHYQIIVERKNNLDSITVEVEVSEKMFSDNVKGLEELERRLRSRLDSVLGLTCGVRLVEPKSIARSEGKAKRVIDRRKYEWGGRVMNWKGNVLKALKVTAKIGLAAVFVIIAVTFAADMINAFRSSEKSDKSAAANTIIDSGYGNQDNNLGGGSFGMIQSAPEFIHPESPSTKYKAAQRFWERGNYQNALNYYQEALDEHIAPNGPNDAETGCYYNSLGAAQYALGLYNEAADSFTRAMAAFDEHGEETDSAVVYSNIAGVRNSQGDYPTALEWYEKALAIRERALGADNLDTAETYNNIGLVYDNQGDYPKALEWYEKALAIRERVLGDDRPDTAMTYNNIAIVYSNQADYSKALEFYEKALAIYEKEFGENDFSTAIMYSNIALDYYNQADYSKALEWYDKAITVYETTLGKNHLTTAMAYNNAAITYAALGDYPKALELHEKALAIREKQLGEYHPDTATTYNNIAVVYYNQWDFKKALEFYEKALAIRENVLGQDHLDTAGTYNNIANVYDRIGDYPKALEFYEKALEIKEAVFGKNHPSTALTYDDIACVYCNQWDYPKALEWHEKALAILEKTLSKDHPDTAVTYNNIGVTYDNQGDYETALEWFLKSYFAYHTVFGDSHPTTKLIIDNMQAAYAQTTPTKPFDQWLEDQRQNSGN